MLSTMHDVLWLIFQFQELKNFDYNRYEKLVHDCRVFLFHFYCIKNISHLTLVGIEISHNFRLSQTYFDTYSDF